jgi:predicted GTPase
VTGAHSEEPLDDVVERAVEEGLDLCGRLEQVVLKTLENTVRDAARAAVEHGDRDGRDILDRYYELLLATRADALVRFDRQRGRLRTFNIVLFGRTGAGKSSLIEALSGGQGKPISQGESDWTTDVRDVRWGACRLYDTPGIAGWGRTVNRAQLERRAEDAVADADIVVLCFDTQSQQEGEFAKVADWVNTYGKPAVAVLNSRNARWRMPVRMGSESARRQLSRSVQEHAGNIRDELTKVGMPDVPIVALHTKRAAFARTSEPYEGPDANSRRKLREEHGPEQLLRWSNLPAFETLISATLQDHASDLRLGMLHEQARGLLEAALGELRDEHRAVAVVGAEQIERGIEGVLRLLGRPTDRRFGKRLTVLEQLRDGGFDVSGAGESRRHAQLQLRAKLRTPRTKALRRAESLIDEAFAERRDVDDTEFERIVLSPALRSVEEVVTAVETEVKSFLEQRLKLVADDVKADLDAALTPFAGARGSAGRDGRRLGIGLEVGSGVGSMGVGGYALAALAINSWNPIGWVGLGVIIVGGIAAKLFGGRARRRATKQREDARGAARAAARKSVNDLFDHLEGDLVEEFGKVFSAAATERLAGEVERAIAMRSVVDAANRADVAITETLSAIPTTGSVASVLAATARDVQRTAHPGDPAADRLLWLGESWCDDPVGLAEHEKPSETTRTAAYDPRRRDALTSRLRSFLHRSSGTPAHGDGAVWLGQTRDVLHLDREALSALAPIVDLVERGRPRLVVAGDYNAGKSSFIKRLLLDAGLPAPEALGVAARPKTDTASMYEWGDWDVIDTPGFQSSNAAHGRRAQAAIDTSSMVLVLFNPNLVVGDPTHLRTLLDGDATRSSKARRTVFVINRADELGVDPHDDLDAYEQLCERKELELRQALGRNAETAEGSVGEDQVVCVASDPFGLVGDRHDVSSSEYDAHRDWDGLDAFHRVLRRQTADDDANALDVAVLDGGAAALGGLVAERRGEIDRIDGQMAQQRRLLLALRARWNAGTALRDSARDRLAADLVNIVTELYDETVLTADPETRQARAGRLEKWHESPEVVQRYDEWRSRTERDLAAWRESTSERIGRRLSSAAFRTAFPDVGAAIDMAHLEPQEKGKAGKVRKAGRAGANAAAGASRDAVYGAAKTFGHRFKPWGAIKLTNRVNVAGAALGLVFGAIELRGVRRSVGDEAEAEENARQARAEALAQVRRSAEAFFDGVEGAGGAGVDVDASLRVLRGIVESSEQRGAALEAECQELIEQVDRCEQQIADARRRS